jgi:two-component system, OmpR family, alkaline phosphatase synthesis response regulator PhoP
MAETILVVDDEPFILRSLSFVLRKQGYDVHEARNGLEALKAVRAHQPDLVFLDVMMPEKNGYEVCQEIKDDPKLQSTHVIMLTAKGQESDRVQGLSAGADEYMTKPFSPSRIIARVREVMAERA